ncbi:MAG: hypothetical protein QW545_06095 [Thermosphaera sp.]
MEVVKAVIFKHNADVKPLLETFNQMVNECIAYALKNKISSPMKLERRSTTTSSKSTDLQPTTAYRLAGWRAE